MNTITLAQGEPLVMRFTVRDKESGDAIDLTSEDKIAAFAQRQGGGERINLAPVIEDGKALVRVDTSSWTVGTYKADAFIQIDGGDERATSQVAIMLRASISQKSDL
jgi:hypothetical protein